MLNPSLIGHLTASLDVERRPSEHDVTARARRELLNRLLLLVEQRENRYALDRGLVVAFELVADLAQCLAIRCRRKRKVLGLFAVEGALRSRFFALALHGVV